MQETTNTAIVAITALGLVALILGFLIRVAGIATATLEVFEKHSDRREPGPSAQKSLNARSRRKKAPSRRKREKGRTQANHKPMPLSANEDVVDGASMADACQSNSS